MKKILLTVVLGVAVSRGEHRLLRRQPRDNRAHPPKDRRAAPAPHSPRRR